MAPVDRSRGLKLWAWPSSLRGRLTALFGIGSALLLVGSAAFVYGYLDHEVQQAINARLRAEAGDVESLTAEPDVQIRRGRFAEVLTVDGGRFGARPPARDPAPLLTPSEIRKAGQGEVVVDKAVPGLGASARLLARRATIAGRPAIVVVGRSIDTEVDAQRRLGIVLAVVSPLLIAAFAGGGWLVAGAALRPVEQMAEEAAAISLEESGRRLPEPAGDDEIARLGRTLNAMLGRIEAAFARERSFVDDASHELRTPVSILRAELELALLDPGDRAETERVLRSALDEADRLARLADDLLVLSRAQSGHLPLRRQPTDVGEVAARAAARFAGGPVEVTVSATGETNVAADPLRLDQVFTNVLANASRHARGVVALTVETVAEGVKVVVADDGDGFPPELLPVAFDRFSRRDASRSRDQGGVGLGLSIVAAIVKAHGGTVDLANGPPLGGAVVRVLLPV